MVYPFELEDGSAGADSGGREIGARRSVETATKPEECGFGFDSITGGGTVGEGAAGAAAMATGAGSVCDAGSCSGSGGEPAESGSISGSGLLSSSGSGPGSPTSNLPSHSAMRPFAADRRRAASSSRSSRLFFFFFAFPSLLRLSLSLSLSFSFESDLADLRESALYVPRSLLDEAPVPLPRRCVRPSASASSPSASSSPSTSTSGKTRLGMVLALRPPKSSSAPSARLEIALSFTAAPESTSSVCS